MKATGAVRRVDTLGRIIIPKQVRESLRIKEGDPLEFFTTKDGGIVLKPWQKYDSKGVDNFIAVFKEMDIIDKENIVKLLMEEMN